MHKVGILPKESFEENSKYIWNNDGVKIPNHIHVTTNDIDVYRYAFLGYNCTHHQHQIYSTWYSL